ncbi:hypothetical protein GR160_08575 [Flavobacterium sp. Sd200]|uniref:hypothetical protein n=1 Tax=Flavobacterium sp. Sd200 TaxID=2692211 RepID=UPI001368B3D6|nr:hypothetical protein [Flavobacterium sp. Sd200]MXN91282.1 hypothetical protein [Flavobacterium sp. Sd200]
MSANLLQPEKIHIITFKITKGQINSPFEFDTVNVEGHNYKLDLDLSFNLGEQLIRADFTVTVETKSTEQVAEEAAGIFSFTFVYKIENIEELTSLENGETIIMHPALANAIASITYSTSRGILLTRFQGTALSNFILPVINPNDLL